MGDVGAERGNDSWETALFYHRTSIVDTLKQVGAFVWQRGVLIWRGEDAFISCRDEEQVKLADGAEEGEQTKFFKKRGHFGE